MSEATIWWLLAGVLVAAELTSGTFYLLLLATGAVVGAAVAMLGGGLIAQITAASLVAALTTALWHWHRVQHPRSAPAAQNRDVNLDIGERVHVAAWQPDHTARVNYRGTQWTARLAPSAPAQPGDCHIVAVEGNWLVLAPTASTFPPAPRAEH